MFRIYCAASTQKDNIGVGSYGTEQDRMMQLADRIAFWLKTQNGNAMDVKFEVFRNHVGYTLEQTIKDCNALACNVFIDNHTNAGSPNAQGTEVYFHQGSSQGKHLATCIFNQVAPLSKGTDRGVMSDYTLYPNKGLAVLRETNPPACLIEHIYHTNMADVADYLAHIEDFAKATAIGVCNYLGVKWVEPRTPAQTIDLLAEDMVKYGIVSDKDYWASIMKGQYPVNLTWLQVAFRNAVNEIKGV